MRAPSLVRFLLNLLKPRHQPNRRDPHGPEVAAKELARCDLMSASFKGLSFRREETKTNLHPFSVAVAAFDSTKEFIVQGFVTCWSAFTNASKSPRPKFSRLSIDTLEGRVVPSTVTIAAVNNGSEAVESCVTSPAKFTVTRDSSVGSTVVHYSLATGTTATSGVDFTALSGTVTITNGNTTADIVVTPLPDTEIEGTEAVKLQLDSATDHPVGCCSSTSATIGSPGCATVTLADDDLNHAPVGASNTVETEEDTPYAFETADFTFSDPNDDPAHELLKVQIVSLPTNGTLKLNDVEVEIDQFIDASDISNGYLVFTPAENANGTAYDSFDFKVQDNGTTLNGGADLDATARTMTIDVTAINDAPTITAGAPTEVDMSIDAVEIPSWLTSFTPGGGSDESGQTAIGYVVSNVSDPSLFTAGPAVDTDGKLTYTLAPFAFGIATFDVTAQDSGGTDDGGEDTSAAVEFTLIVAQRVTFTVNTLNDTDDASLDGVALDSNDDTSLRAAIQEGNYFPTGTVVKIEFSVSGTIYLAYGALPTLVGNTFEIDGTSITIDAGASSGIFSIDSSTTAAIDYFTLTNTDNADAVYNEGTLSMTSITVTNAQAGGTTNFGGTVTLPNPTYINATRANPGGAFWNQAGGTLTITGGWFDSNTATGGGGSGGAIASTGNGSVLNITGGSYLLNTSQGNGGAIYVGAGTAFITNASIYWNQAGTTLNPMPGGGIFAAGTLTTIVGGEIMVNTGSLGGGVYVSAGNLTIQGGAQIYSNTATQFGGGIYFIGGTLNMSGNSTLYSNSAAIDGGGLYLDTGTANLTNVSVTSNTAGRSGGAFYVNGANRTLSLVQGCTVSGNSAQTGNGARVAANGTLNENLVDNTWGVNDDIVRD